MSKWVYKFVDSYDEEGDLQGWDLFEPRIHQAAKEGWRLFSIDLTGMMNAVMEREIIEHPEPDPKLAAISKIVNKIGPPEIFSDLVGTIKLILASNPQDAEGLANDYCNRHGCIVSPGWREIEEILSPEEMAKIKAKFTQAAKRYEDLTPEELDAQTFNRGL